jgi:FkbM family methyltransferase
MLPKMIGSILSAVKKRLTEVSDRPSEEFALKSYSQEGEDMVLRRIFEGQPSGFFVDVGAHHPHRFSNTFYFYQLGWSGINIEPNPDALAAFSSTRPRDINLQLGVSDNPGMLAYYQFDEPALNTFDYAIVKSRLANTSYKLKSTSEVSVSRLDSILATYLPKGTRIDFLSVDAEGYDLAVLKSNDWDLYRPRCVLVEMLNSSLEDAMRGDIYQFMKSKDYALFAKTFNTLIFLCPQG